jgi:hypothetical protein
MGRLDYMGTLLNRLLVGLTSLGFLDRLVDDLGLITL